MTTAADTDREQLEAERDHLLRSLDDLELEHASGGIDDESYRELHDDYTARAAAVLRALRDGVDARPKVTTAPSSSSMLRRRAVVLAIVVVFALGAGLSLASALGARLPGQTGSGNTQAGDDQVSAAARKRVERLRAAVQAAPQDWTLRAQLADALERTSDLAGAIDQWQTAITIDGTRPQGHANFARLLYLAAGSVPNEATRNELIARARVSFDKAIEVDPEGRYPDSRYFRAVLLLNSGEALRAQADLQRYLVLAPNGAWADDVRALLAKVTTALETSTTVPPTTTR